jgi:hypothetical protein
VPRSSPHHIRWRRSVKPDPARFANGPQPVP